MVYSEGVTNVFPSSFMTAATNFLVSKMIQKSKVSSIDKFDQDYDLADFVEGYVQNISELSIKLKNRLGEALYHFFIFYQNKFKDRESKPYNASLASDLKNTKQIDQRPLDHLKEVYFPQFQNPKTQSLDLSFLTNKLSEEDASFFKDLIQFLKNTKIRIESKTKFRLKYILMIKNSFETKRTSYSIRELIFKVLKR